jgi:hypothetical protein
MRRMPSPLQSARHTPVNRSVGHAAPSAQPHVPTCRQRRGFSRMATVWTLIALPALLVAGAAAVWAVRLVRGSGGVPVAPAARAADVGRSLSVSAERAARHGGAMADKAKGPRAVLDEETYDFGDLLVGGRGSHDFVIRNGGDAPLRLVKGDTTCRCTALDIAQGRLQPGESCRVRLEWEATEPTPRFRHGAVLLTNDPLRRQLRLVVTGRVLSALSASPGELIFTDVPAGSSRVQRLLLFSQTAEQLDVLDISCTLPELSWELLSADPAALRAASARSGVLLLLTMAAPASERRFSGTLHLRMRLVNGSQMDEEHLLELPVAGNVRNPISVYGAGWDPDGRLRLGKLLRGRGARHTLFVSAPSAAHFEVRRVSVAELKASVRPLPGSGQDACRYAVDIEIPPDTPPLDCMGEQEAIVELATGVDLQPTLLLRIQFCVLD